MVYLAKFCKDHDISFSFFKDIESNSYSFKFIRNSKTITVSIPFHQFDDGIDLKLIKIIRKEFDL